MTPSQWLALALGALVVSAVLTVAAVAPDLLATWRASLTRRDS
jgi:hypothetical protein